MSAPVFSLAPMAGFSDSVFRRICGELGADFAVSEMISAVALAHRDKKTARLAKIEAGEPPVVLQIFGHDPGVMAEAAELLLSGDYPGCGYAAPPVGIDLNMGCPMKKIVNNGDGCALMNAPALAARIIEAVKPVCVRHGVPLCVKFRAGWDRVTAPDFARTAAEAGADKITLHCRTREQMYAPCADPSVAEAVANALQKLGPGVPLPKLFGNGDVDSPAAARRYFDAGCVGAAVGRAALGNPWLFSELKNGERFSPPAREEIVSMILRIVRESAAAYGEVVGVRESRGRAACLLRGLRGSAALRDRLNRAATVEQFESILAEWLEI